MPIKISELLGNPSDDEASSDSEQEKNLQFKENLTFHESPQDKELLRRIIQETNGQLRAGQAVDLAKYPQLFVVHFRGVHFFKQFIPQPDRRDVRNRINNNIFQGGIYSPAVYELAGLTIGEPIDTPEKKQRMKQAIQTLNEKFADLAQTPARTRSWWGERRMHDTQLHRHYQRYVNKYAEFRKESSNKSYACYSMLPTTRNPYISTADDAKHAVAYALGGKTELTQGCLRPSYAGARPKHPKVGYVQIIFHKLHSLRRNNPLFLSVLHADNKIDINGRLLNERETTFKVHISSKHIVYTKVLRFPAFNVAYSINYHNAKYGISTSQGFSRYKNNLTPTKADKTTTLLDKIAEHFAAQLTNKARQIAKTKRGFIVYLGLDGLLHENLPATAEISTARARNQDLGQAFSASLDLYQGYDSGSESEEEVSETEIDALLVKILGPESILNVSTSTKVTISNEEIKKLAQSMAQAFLNQMHQKPNPKNSTALATKAARQGFQCRDTGGDGNCFYLALLDQLQNVLQLPAFTNMGYQDIIDIGINEILNNIDFYQDFATLSINVIVEKLLTPGEWADHLIIQAVANALGIKIVVIRSDGAPNQEVNPRAAATATIHLGYEVGWHYQSLIRNT